MTRLDKPLRRELQIGDAAYTLTIDPKGLKLVGKGRFRFIGFPLRIRGGTASPIRAVARFD